MSFVDATHAFHALGPRNRFVQTTCINGVILDVGAGDGGLVTLRKWLAPKRSDLQLFAWSGEKAQGLEDYNGHEIGYWPDYVPDFNARKFDAIVSANFIEHIERPLEFIKWAASRLKRGGRFYLEWPRTESIELPSTAELAAVNVPVMTGRYHDDVTHQKLPPLFEEVKAALEAEGLVIRESGIVSVPTIDRELAIHARRMSDTVSMTMSYWSVSGWCQYLVAAAPLVE